MKSFLTFLCLLAFPVMAQQPFNANNIRLANPPVQGTTGNISRILTLNPQGVAETITPTKNWDAIVATGTVDTTDISGFSTLGRNLVDDVLQDDMLSTLGATTVGKSFFNTANPSAITFVRVNANNSISYQTAANFRTDIGGTTIGQGYFTLTNPSAITFPRQNANNTVTSRTAVELKTDLSLENVDNTSDANKPVSTATQTALNLKANLAGPTFTGTLTSSGKIVATGESVTLAAAATTFAVTTNFVTLTGDAGANTISTITGGVQGMVLVIKFVDSLVTITDTAANTADTVNLSAAWASTSSDTLTLIFDGTKWFETCRSVN